MNQIANIVSSLTPQAREALRQELDRQDPRESSDFVAVIGAAVRLPGAITSLEKLWEFLARGGDAVGPVPTDRWPGRRDRSANARDWGAFIDDVAGFDARRFGISPLEAITMDPQQRHLLEVTAEAIAHAGLREQSLRGSRTGVYMGLSSNDYLTVGAKTNTPIDAYSATGNPHSVAVGRVSYQFDLRGPCLAIDTACSSSLVAIDTAVHGLAENRCALALAGGIHLMLDPHSTEALEAWSMLSPEGKIKAFDARADGFVRGEGCVVLVLKRLKDAEADGDRILAVILNSAVNQDGRSNGLTAPNQASQIAVMREALSGAGIDPREVVYIETHGTGTPLGDPVEFGAIANVYGAGTKTCYVGAIKSNMGHLEAAAGALSVVKTISCLRHRKVPPNLHFRSWNPAMEISGTRLVVPTRLEELPGEARRVVAGVSAFGFGGTNAHALLSTHVDTEWPSVWIFPGQGGQFAGMGCRFLHEDTHFAAKVDELDPQFRSVVGVSLRSALDGSAELEGIGTIQPALFGFQLAAASMLEATQGAPSAVIGHSMGEVAAAVVAGILTQEQGLRVIAERSRLLSELPSGGAMAVVRCGGDEIRRWSQLDHGQLEVAALNGPQDTVLAGSVHDIDALAERCRTQRGPAVSVIRVDVASHSRFVDPILEQLRDALYDLGPTRPPRYPIFSTCSLDDDWGVEHWVANLREPVKFSDSVAKAVAEGANRFTEVSPHPVLLDAVDRDTGLGVKTRAIQVRPPHWRHQRFWYNNTQVSQRVDPKWGLVDMHVSLPGQGHVLQGDLGSERCPWLADHRLFGTPVAPGSTLMELCASAAVAASPERSVVNLHDVRFLGMLPLEDSVTITVLVSQDDHTVEVITTPDGTSTTTHATAHVDFEQREWPTPLVSPSLDGTASARRIEPEQLLSRARRAGQEYGPHFQLLTEVIDFGDGWVEGSVAQPKGAPRGLVVDPRTLDAAIQMMAAALPDGAQEQVIIPVSVDRMFVGSPGSQVVRVVGQGRQQGRDWCMDLDLWADGETEPVVSVRGLRARPLGRAEAPFSWSSSLYEVEWVAEADPANVGTAPTNLTVIDATSSEASQEVAHGLIAARDQGGFGPGHTVIVVDGAASTRQDAARELLDSVASLVASESRPALVTLVTLGNRGDGAARAARALVRTAALEVPDLPIRTVSASRNSEELGSLLTRLWGADSLALTSEGTEMARCVRASLPRTVEGMLVRPDSAYLVTGGMGGLGLQIAAALTSEGAGCVILNGRNRPQPGSNAALDKLIRDERVVIVLGDIADEDTVGQCRAEVFSRGLELRGVVHAAGVVADQTFAGLNSTTVDRMWRPKVGGVIRLDADTADDPLDFFIVFSTAGTILGSPGQAGYVVANAAMEGIVADRQRRGLPGTIVQWGRWGEVGLAADARDRMMDLIPPDQGVAILRRLIVADRPETLAARLNESVLLANFPQVADQPFYASLIASGAAQDSISVDALRAMLPAQAQAEIQRGVTRVVAQLLGYGDSEIPRDQPLTDLGLDSLLVLRIVRGIEHVFSVKLGVAALLQGATTTEIAEHVASKMLPNTTLGDDSVNTTTTGETAETRAEIRSAHLNRLRKRGKRS